MQVIPIGLERTFAPENPFSHDGEGIGYRHSEDQKRTDRTDVGIAALGQCQRHESQRKSKTQASCIAHEHGGRIPVESQKAEHSTGQGKVKEHERLLAGQRGVDGKR